MLVVEGHRVAALREPLQRGQVVGPAVLDVGGDQPGRLVRPDGQHLERLAERDRGLVGHAGELAGAHHPDDGQAGAGVHEPGSLTGARRAGTRARCAPRPYTAPVSVVDRALRRVPQPYRDVAVRHRELVKFAMVGGTTYIVDIIIFTVLKSTVLEPKPVTAKIVAVLVATMVSYVLNREWSFRTRGGRERHHEAALFFLVCGIGLVINAVPLYLSRYGLHLQTPNVDLVTQEIADFVSANIIGTLLAMVFRWWAFRRYVFPDQNARSGRTPVSAGAHGDPLA